MSGDNSTQPDSTGPNDAKAARDSPLNPTSLSVDDVARLLSRVGGVRITSDDVQSDIDSGAPISAEGRINLLHYAAWLLNEQGSGANR